MIIRRILFRRNLRKTDFFESVTFGRKKYQKYIEDFLYLFEDCSGIKIKDIKINKFINLFSTIAFPIKVEFDSQYCPHYLQILDKEGKRYYVKFEEVWNASQKKSLRYKVWREIQLNWVMHGKSVIYEINQRGIETRGFENYTIDNGKKSCIQYENGIATAIVEDGEKCITIKYTSNSESEDKLIMEYLYNMKHIEFDNVVPLFSFFIKRFKKKNDIISIRSNLGERICSEILFKEAIVTNYSYTEKIDDNEKCFYEISLSEDVEGFISKHQK